MKKYSKKEKTIFLLLSFIAIFTFLLLTGTFNSSYHLQDDHEFLRILLNIKDEGFFNTLFHWVSDSFSIRFRPLYFIIRVPLVSLLGLHFKAWYLWKGLEICIISFFLYFFARNLKCNKFKSILFIFLTLVGGQTAIWYRLGPQEATALVFLSMSLYFISEYCLYEKKKIYNVIIYISTILMSLMKESFVLMIPFVVFLKLILEYKNSNDDIKENFKKNKGFLITFILLFILEIIIIVFFIGTNKIGYAGFSSDTTTYQYLDGIKKSLLSNSLLPILLLFCFSCGIVFNFPKKIKCKERNLLIAILLFVFGIIVAQLILHAKSTMSERYIVPMSVAYSFMFAIITPNFIKNQISKVVYFTLVFIVCLNLFNIAVDNAKSFAQNGNNINGYLYHIRNNCNNEVNVFIAMDGELMYSSGKYLDYYGYKNIYQYFDIERYHKLDDKNEFNIKDIKDKISIILITNNYYEKVFDGKIFDESDFESIIFGNYILYKRQVN